MEKSNVEIVFKTYLRGIAKDMAKTFTENALKNKSDYKAERIGLSNKEYQHLYMGKWANVEDLKKLSGEIKEKEDQVHSLRSAMNDWKVIEPLYWGHNEGLAKLLCKCELTPLKSKITFVDKNAYIAYEFLRSLFLSYYDGKTENFKIEHNNNIGYFFFETKTVKFQNMDFLNKCTKCEDENYSCIIVAHDDLEFEVMRTCSCGNTLKFFIPAKEVSYYNYAENEPELWIRDELAERLSSGEVIVKFTDILKEKIGMVSFIFADRNAVIA